MPGYTALIKNAVLNKPVGTLVTSLVGANQRKFNTLVNDSTGALVPRVGESSTTLIFNNFDKNKNGKIDKKEINDYLIKYYNIKLADVENWSTEKLVNYIEQVDNARNKKTNVKKVTNPKPQPPKKTNVYDSYYGGCHRWSSII